jgi:uncharacterized LabA/DUF88 family protein
MRIELFVDAAHLRMLIHEFSHAKKHPLAILRPFDIKDSAIGIEAVGEIATFYLYVFAALGQRIAERMELSHKPKCYVYYYDSVRKDLKGQYSKIRQLFLALGTAHQLKEKKEQLGVQIVPYNGALIENRVSQLYDDMVYASRKIANACRHMAICLRDKKRVLTQPRLLKAFQDTLPQKLKDALWETIQQHCPYAGSCDAVRDCVELVGTKLSVKINPRLEQNGIVQIPSSEKEYRQKQVDVALAVDFITSCLKNAQRGKISATYGLLINDADFIPAVKKAQNLFLERKMDPPIFLISFETQELRTRRLQPVDSLITLFDRQGKVEMIEPSLKSAYDQIIGSPAA